MWLVGMMGSGKTSVGRLVARAVQAVFYDTDEAIVAMAGRSIAALWDDLGETHLRDLERSAIEAAPSRVVAAAGGGAALDPVNRKTMRLDPPVVWLQASPETLAGRLGGSFDRPLLSGPRSRVEVLREILADRANSYAAVATDVVATDDLDLEEVAEEVTALWPG